MIGPGSFRFKAEIGEFLQLFQGIGLFPWFSNREIRRQNLRDRSTNLLYANRFQRAGCCPKLSEENWA